MPRSCMRSLCGALRSRVDSVSSVVFKGRGKNIDMTEQPEVDERHDSLVVEGDDAGHVLPPTELDPYTPEPGAPQAARRAMVLALVIIVCILLVVGIYAAVH